MKKLLITIVISSPILAVQADSFPDEICVKEIWESSGEGVAPSSVDDDSGNSDQNGQGQKAWPTRPKPEVDDSPSMFAPKPESKGGKEYFPGGDNE